MGDLRSGVEDGTWRRHRAIGQGPEERNRQMPFSAALPSGSLEMIHVGTLIDCTHLARLGGCEGEEEIASAVRSCGEEDTRPVKLSWRLSWFGCGGVFVTALLAALPGGLSRVARVNSLSGHNSSIPLIGSPEPAHLFMSLDSPRGDLVNIRLRLSSLEMAR